MDPVGQKWAGGQRGFKQELPWHRTGGRCAQSGTGRWLKGQFLTKDSKAEKLNSLLLEIKTFTIYFSVYPEKNLTGEVPEMQGLLLKAEHFLLEQRKK